MYGIEFIPFYEEMRREGIKFEGRVDYPDEHILCFRREELEKIEKIAEKNGVILRSSHRRFIPTRYLF